MRQNPDEFIGVKWSPMVVLSIVFHLAVFSFILFLPESMSTTRRLEGIVYEVDLVELPRGGDLERKASGGTTTKEKERKSKTFRKTEATALRIPTQKQQEKPVVIAKRTVPKETSPIETPKISSSQLIDKAISKLEKKVKSEAEEQTHIDQAISKIEGKVGQSSRGSEGAGSGRPGGRSLSGMATDLYRMEVEIWIKSHWSYPVALRDSSNLEAVVVVMAKSDGTILETQFKKRSANAVFDESVSKAVERSNPLPPFPESYRESYDEDEIEITFNLKDLEND